MDAERKLRLERFELVVIDLMLPDSTDEDATVTRIASMGKFRVAVVSGSDKRNDVVAEPDARGRQLLAQGRRQGRPAAWRFRAPAGAVPRLRAVADAPATSRRPSKPARASLPTSARIAPLALHREREGTTFHASLIVLLIAAVDSQPRHSRRHPTTKRGSAR